MRDSVFLRCTAAIVYVAMGITDLEKIDGSNRCLSELNQSPSGLPHPPGRNSARITRCLALHCVIKSVLLKKKCSDL